MELIFYMVMLLNIKRSYGCCKWEYNTTHAAIINKAENTVVKDEAECCSLCKRKQLNDMTIKTAVLSHSHCYCLAKGSITPSPLSQTSTVFAHTIWFSDEREEFPANHDNTINVNFCGNLTGEGDLELYSIDANLPNTSNNVMYFPSTSYKYDRDPDSKRITKVIPPLTDVGAMKYTRISQRFKIGRVEEKKEFFVVLAYSNAESIILHLKGFTVKNATRNAFVKLKHVWSTSHRKACLKTDLSNNHDQTNADIDDVYFYVYYNQKMLSMTSRITSVYSTLTKYKAPPLVAKASILLGGNIVVYLCFWHVEEAVQSYSLEVFVEVHSPKFHDGFRANFIETEIYSHKFSPEEKAEDIFKVYYIYLGDRMFYCYHERVRIENFCGILQLTSKNIQILPGILREPICFDFETQCFYFYDYFGNIINYSTSSMSFTHVIEPIGSILGHSNISRPVRGTKQHYPGPGYFLYVAKFDGKSLIASRFYWKFRGAKVYWP